MTAGVARACARALSPTLLHNACPSCTGPPLIRVAGRSQAGGGGQDPRLVQGAAVAKAAATAAASLACQAGPRAEGGASGGQGAAELRRYPCAPPLCDDQMGRASSLVLFLAADPMASAQPQSAQLNCAASALPLCDDRVAPCPAKRRPPRCGLCCTTLNGRDLIKPRP